MSLIIKYYKVGIMKNSVRRSFVLISTLLLAILIPLSSTAQNTNDVDLITYFEGDLWSYNAQANTIQQITSWGFNSGPALSPQGTQIAYVSTALQAVQTARRGNFVGFIGRDIYIMDVITKQATRINDQSGATAEEGIMRSMPSWSPDGTRLTWVQFQVGFSPSLQIYDLRTEVTSTLDNDVNIGFQDGGEIFLSSPNWDRGGIARIFGTISAVTNNFTYILEITDPNTGIKISHDLGSNDDYTRQYYDFVWVHYQGQRFIALFSYQQWGLLNPLTGEVTILPSPPRLRRVGMTDSLELSPFTIQYDPNTWGVDWQVDNGTQNVPINYQPTFFNSRQNLPTLSPDGSSIAWYDHLSGHVNIWRAFDGETRILSNTNTVNDFDYLRAAPFIAAWAPVEWYIKDVNTTPSPPVASDNCFGSPPTRLSPNTIAVVLPGDANNIRNFVGGDVIGQIPGDGVFSVTGTPECDANGLRYYPIAYNGIIGWTAEGQGDEYWVAPR